MNMILAYPNRAKSGACTLTGGAWEVSMPLANLLDPVLGIRARSADLALASTQFDAALASPYPARVLALAHHSLSQTARFRVRASNTAGNFNVGTNLLTYSEQFDNAAWVKSGVTVTPNAAVGPDGAMTADKLVATAASSFCFQAFAAAPNTDYTASLYVKSSAAAATLNLRFYRGAGAAAFGEVTFTTSGEWQRISLTGNSAAHAGPFWFAIGGNSTFATGEELYVAGCQLNPGTTADPYQPTTTTTLTKGAIYDSGWLDVWPLLWSDVAWEDAHWWSGTYTPDEIDGYRFTLIHVLPSSQAASYWRVELDDAANSAGAVDIGRLFLGDGWQPLYNYNYGAAIGRQSRTKSREAQSGTRYYTRRASRRSFRGVLANLTGAEAYGDAYELQRLQDVSEECLFIPDPDDAEQMWRRAMLCTLRTLSDIEHPYPNTYSMPIELEEIL